MLAAANPGIEARVAATVASILRCSSSPAMTLTGRSASAAPRSLIVAVTTMACSAIGEETSSITTIADSSPTATSTVAPRYPSRSTRTA